jgi:catechol 2,3-dioxygenase-like lactoylglutathione lyase family enzyme
VGDERVLERAGGVAVVSFGWKHVALFVPDLRSAEDFYRPTFDLELLFRERRQDDGDWYTLQPDTAWDEAASRGIEPDMVALARDDFVLALFRGTPQPGTVVELSVGMTRDELDNVRARLPGGLEVSESASAISFDDPFGFHWFVKSSETRFRSSGEIAGRWLR